jgi:cytosine/adenosine deaminase-related metal-dependent hydrolase
MEAGLGERATADILIQDCRITVVGSDIAAPDGAEVIDASRLIVLPGFVDTHRHMWQTQLRGEMMDATLLDYVALIRGVYSACYEPEDVYIGILAGYLDALNAGTTTLIDHCHIMNSAEHTDAAIRAVHEDPAPGAVRLLASNCRPHQYVGQHCALAGAGARGCACRGRP